MSNTQSQNPSKHHSLICPDCTRGRKCRVLDIQNGQSCLVEHNNRKVMTDEEIAELLEEHYQMDVVKKLIADEDMNMEKSSADKKQKRKKDPVRPPLAVKKPNGVHMPYCSNTGCKRRVSDARKLRCAHCTSMPTSYQTYGYDYLDGYMD